MELEERLPSRIYNIYDSLSVHFLAEIWTQMGLDEEALQLRKEVVYEVLTKTMMKMKSEEEDTLANIFKRIELFGKESNRLQKELGIIQDDVDSNLSVIHLEKHLRHKVQNLEKIKEEQMKEVKNLIRRDHELCGKLEMERFHISVNVVPTKSELDALKEHVRKLQVIKLKRFGQFLEAKTIIVSDLEMLDEDPETPFERLVVCKEDETFILSASNLVKVQLYLQDLEDKINVNKSKAEALRNKIFNLMLRLDIDPKEKEVIMIDLPGHSARELKELQVKLNELEILKLEKMEEIIHFTRRELVHYWDLCYYSKNQREKFAPFFSTGLNEITLNQHEEELEKIKEYYSANKNIFELIASRQKLWEKMLELEAKQKDPNRLKKAKGAELLIEENDRKLIKTKLPKVSKELKLIMSHYFDENHTPFLVGGIPYEDFLEQQEENYMLQKENDKQQRKKINKKQTIQEAIYGSKLVTPAKRKRDPSPVAGPSSKHSRLLIHGSSTLGQYPANVSGIFTRQHSRHRARKQTSRTRQQPPRARKILGNDNSSVIMAGSTGKNQTNDTFSTLTSEKFLLGIPNAALTSTFQRAFETTKKIMTKGTPVLITPVKRPGTLKTPSSRICTPAHRSNKKPLTTLRSGKQIPFLI